MVRPTISAAQMSNGSGLSASEPAGDGADFEVAEASGNPLEWCSHTDRAQSGERLRSGGLFVARGDSVLSHALSPLWLLELNGLQQPDQCMSGAIRLRGKN